jgi:histidyl-tRNA synthetase
MCVEKGLDEKVADRIGEFVVLNGSVDLVHKMMEGELGTNKSAKKGLEALKILHGYCQDMDIDHVFKFDLSLARGLDYYTGVIYEVVLTEGDHEVGSIAAGGRYDGLVGSLSDNQKHQVPCVGISIGIERILAIIEQQMAAAGNLYPTQCYVASAGKNMVSERFKLLSDLWGADIRAEHSYKSNAKLLAQFQYCEEKGIPVAIIIGENEIKQGVVKIRVIKTREEVEVQRDCLVGRLETLLDQLDH